MGQEAVIAVGTTYVYSLNKVLWRGPPKWPKPEHNPYLNYMDAMLLAYRGLRSGLGKASLPVDQQEIADNTQ